MSKLKWSATSVHRALGDAQLLRNILGLIDLRNTLAGDQDLPRTLTCASLPGMFPRFIRSRRWHDDAATLLFLRLRRRIPTGPDRRRVVRRQLAGRHEHIPSLRTLGLCAFIKTLPASQRSAFMMNAATWPSHPKGNKRANIGEISNPKKNAAMPVHANHSHC